MKLRHVSCFIWDLLCIFQFFKSKFYTKTLKQAQDSLDQNRSEIFARLMHKHSLLCTRTLLSIHCFSLQHKWLLSALFVSTLEGQMGAFDHLTTDDMVALWGRSSYKQVPSLIRHLGSVLGQSFWTVKIRILFKWIDNSKCDSLLQMGRSY